MTQPHDEFGTYLRKLRTARRATAQAVSRAVGRSDTYIGGWERYNRPINMDVLEAVARELKLPVAERQQLLRLAFNRNHPAVAYDWTDEAKVATVNMSTALHYVERGTGDLDVYDWAVNVTEAATYILALYAISGFTEYDVGVIQWPKWVYRDKIVTRPASSQPLSEGLLSKLAIPDSLRRNTRTASGTSFTGHKLADVYRLWLFSDLDRCTSLAGALAQYSVDWAPLLGVRVTFDFGNGKADRLLNAQRVSDHVVTTACKRLLVDCVWTSRSARTLSDSRRWFPHALEACDVQAVHAAFWAQQYLDRGQWQSPVSQYIAQIVRDAAFSLRLIPKGNHLVAVAMYDMYLQLTGDPRRNVDASVEHDDIYGEAESGLADMLKLVLSATTLMETETQPAPGAARERTTRRAKRGKAKKKSKA